MCAEFEFNLLLQVNNCRIMNYSLILRLFLTCSVCTEEECSSGRSACRTQENLLLKFCLSAEKCNVILYETDIA